MKTPNHLDTQTERGIKFNYSDYTNTYVLSGSAATVTIPAGYTTVSFTTTGNFSANFVGQTASMAASTTGVGDEINPTTRYIRGLTSFSIYAPGAATVSASFYN